MILLLPLLQCQVLKLNLSDFGQQQQQQQQHYHRRGTCQCQLPGKASAPAIGTYVLVCLS